MRKKRKLGDRRDGTLLRKVDSMHFITPLIMPNRCDNEAFISERIDLTAINAYLEKKNQNNPVYKYNLFQVIVTAILKILMHRPLLNRFIANGNIYQRNEISAAFVIKKIFADDAPEGLAFLRAKEDDTLDSIHDAIYRKVSSCRTAGKKDNATESMDLFTKMPRFLAKFLVRIARFLDNFDLVPASLIAGDPYHSSVVLSNIGSIKLRSGYHHLTNWGTTSLFVVIGEKKIRPFFDEDGKVSMRDSVDLGLTVDERVADGYYYSKTVRLLKKLLENPELLELPLKEEVDY